MGGEVLERRLRLLELVDLARDPDQPDDLALGIVQRELGGVGPVQAAVGELAALDQARDRLVGLHHAQVLEMGALGEFAPEQVGVRLAEQVGRAGVRHVRTAARVITSPGPAGGGEGQ